MKTQPWRPESGRSVGQRERGPGHVMFSSFHKMRSNEIYISKAEPAPGAPRSGRRATPAARTINVKPPGIVMFS